MDKVVLVNADNYDVGPVIDLMREYGIDAVVWNRPHYDSYDISVYDELVNIANSRGIYVIVFISVLDIAPTSEEAIDVLDYMHNENIYCFALNLRGSLYNSGNIQLANYNWTFEEYLQNNNIDLGGKNPDYIESVRQSYELHKTRSKIAIEGGYGHKKGEPLVHHDKAEKMNYILENHKQFNGSMNGRQVMASYAKKTGNTFSPHTLRKYIKELRLQINAIDEPDETD